MNHATEARDGEIHIFRPVNVVFLKCNGSAHNGYQRLMDSMEKVGDLLDIENTPNVQKFIGALVQKDPTFMRDYFS